MRFFSPMRLLLTAQFLATAVLSLNDHASQLWTLVGCDDVDLDNILDAAHDLATAATEALAGFTKGPVPKSGKAWSDIKQAMLIWGVDFDDVEQDMVEVPEREYDLLEEIYGRYEDMMKAVENPGVWDRDTTYFFCKAFETPYPFVVAENVGDYVNNMPPDQADLPLSNFGMQVAYYPPAGFIQDARNAENEGRRLITFRDDLGHANFDGNPCYLETAEAVTWTDSADHSIKFLTLCSSFYTWPERYEKADVDEEADNLDHWTRTQAALLLHELMHLRFPEVIDVVAKIGDMTEAKKMYNYKNCCGLSGLYHGGSRDLAKMNADNYRMFAVAAYLDPRPWDNVFRPS